VTNALVFLQQTDQIVFLDQGGLASSGTYETLRKSNPKFKAFLDKHVKTVDDQSKI
jgi:ABC-type transport system involved in cytochrome bd biosynthesis fused ATPase/permease subunit